MLLFVTPACRSLLKKGIDPLRGIGQKQVAHHHFAGDVVGYCEGMIDLVGEGLLAETDRRRTPGQNNIGEPPNFGVQPADRNDRVDEPLVAASMGSPVSSISIACFRPTFRTTATAGVEQNAPIFTPGIANFAVPAAT